VPKERGAKFASAKELRQLVAVEALVSSLDVDGMFEYSLL
jgi:hypothetical protein